ANDTLNIRSMGAPTTVSTPAAGTDTINLGSSAPATSGMVDNLQQPLTVTGDGHNTTLNVDDAGQTGDRTGALTATTLTGLGYSDGVTYSGLAALHVYLGSGSDTFNVQSTPSPTVTTINAGAGTDTIT